MQQATCGGLKRENTRDEGHDSDDEEDAHATLTDGRGEYRGDRCGVFDERGQIRSCEHVTREREQCRDATNEDGEVHRLGNLTSGILHFFGYVTTGLKAVEHEETDECGTEEQWSPVDNAALEHLEEDAEFVVAVEYEQEEPHADNTDEFGCETDSRDASQHLGSTEVQQQRKNQESERESQVDLW